MGGGNKTGRVIICYWKFYFVDILHFECTAGGVYRLDAAVVIHDIR